MCVCVVFVCVCCVSCMCVCVVRARLCVCVCVQGYSINRSCKYSPTAFSRAAKEHAHACTAARYAARHELFIHFAYRST